MVLKGKSTGKIFPVKIFPSSNSMIKKNHQNNSLPMDPAVAS